MASQWCSPGRGISGIRWGGLGGRHDPYCWSVTFSIQTAVSPSSASEMAIWLMAVVGVAPCQCFTPGGIQTISPGRISCFGPLSQFTQPQPDTTISVWPSGCVCQAVRAPGSKVTVPPSTGVEPVLSNVESILTEPVKYSAGACSDGCDPIRVTVLLRSHTGCRCRTNSCP